MLEYIFFHRQSLEDFVARLEHQAIAYQARDDAMGLVVAVAENLPDDVTDRFDAFYEKLLDDAENRLAGEDEAAETHTAGLNITLSDGRTTSVEVAPELLNRILRVITFAELNQLVDAIVTAVENPDNRPLCQR
jgi:FPC/CPF motif-containing protein YcgG